MSIVELIGGIFVVLLAIAFLAYVVTVYNRLVRADERCENTWSDIDVVLQQRQDELDKLIDTARQAMDYEEDVLSTIVEAREVARSASTPREQAEADRQIRTALASFRARAEDHPELSATENLMQLQQNIAEIEEQLADRREVYNESVTTYNTLCRAFPYLIFASIMGFPRRELFETDETARDDVDVGTEFADEPGADSAVS